MTIINHVEPARTPGGLLISGIDALEASMLADKELYNQNVAFAEVHSCGTVMCAAGIAHLRKVGAEQFLREANERQRGFSYAADSAFMDACITAGCELLGIDIEKTELGVTVPAVFNTIRFWPTSLSREFEACAPGEERVHFYINMLRTRAQKDGSIL